MSNAKTNSRRFTRTTLAMFARSWESDARAARAAMSQTVRHARMTRAAAFKRGVRETFNAGRAGARLESIVDACARPKGGPRYVATEVVATIVRSLSNRCDRAVRAAAADCMCIRDPRDETRDGPRFMGKSGEKIAPENHGHKCQCGKAEDRLYRAAIRAICTARPDAGCVAPAYKAPLGCQLEHARRPSSMLGRTDADARADSADVFDAVRERIDGLLEARTMAVDAGMHASAASAGKRRVSGKRGASKPIQTLGTSYVTQETPRRVLAAVCAFKRIPVPAVPESLLLARRVAKTHLDARGWLLSVPVSRPCACNVCVTCYGAVGASDGPCVDSRTCDARKARAAYDVALASIEAWYARAVRDARNATPSPIGVNAATLGAIRPVGESRKAGAGERTFVLTRDGVETFACHALTVGDALRTLLPLAGARVDSAGTADGFAAGHLTLATRSPGKRTLEGVNIIDVRAVLGAIARASRKPSDARIIAGIVAREMRAATEGMCVDAEWSPPDARITRLEELARGIRGRLWALRHPTDAACEERAWNTAPMPVDMAILARRRGMIDRIIRDANDKRIVAAARAEAIYCAAVNARNAEAARA